jgi:hypothetical protein
MNVKFIEMLKEFQQWNIDNKVKEINLRFYAEDVRLFAKSKTHVFESRSPFHNAGMRRKGPQHGTVSVQFIPKMIEFFSVGNFHTVEQKKKTLILSSPAMEGLTLPSATF